MKVQKFKFKQLLKLHLLKSRVYEHPIKKTNFNDLTTMSLDQTLVGIKKALQVIFQYHQMNKRILFVGLPSKLELKINLLTRHTSITRSFSVQGIISNNNTNSLLDIQSPVYNSVKYNSILLTPKLTKKPDLIVLFDHDKSFSILSEAWIAKTPVIHVVVKDHFMNSSVQGLYSINGNFKSILSTFDKNIFFIGLNFLFKNLKKKKKASSPSELPKSVSKFFNNNGKRSGRKSK